MILFKLYDAGFRHIRGVFASETEEGAILAAQHSLNLHALPCEAKEIQIPGFKIIVQPEEVEDGQSQIRQVPVAKRGGVSKATK